MLKQAFVVALLAAGIYISVTPQDGEPPFHFTSQLSSDGRTPFFSRLIHARGRRVFISVDIKNPNDAYFALCVEPPGRRLPQYARKRACGGQVASVMTPGDHDTVQRLVILEDRAVTLEWCVALFPYGFFVTLCCIGTATSTARNLETSLLFGRTTTQYPPPNSKLKCMSPCTATGSAMWEAQWEADLLLPYASRAPPSRPCLTPTPSSAPHPVELPQGQGGA